MAEVKQILGPEPSAITVADADRSHAHRRILPREQDRWPVQFRNRGRSRVLVEINHEPFGLHSIRELPAVRRAGRRRYHRLICHAAGLARLPQALDDCP